MKRHIPRILLGPVLSVGAAGVLIIFSLWAASSTLRWVIMSSQLNAIDHDECTANPSSWGWKSGKMSMFAYDRSGHTAQSAAPPIERDLLQRALRTERAAFERSPDRVVAIIPFKTTGPCAVLRTTSTNVEGSF
ncbi:MAG: hypothetical protein AAFV29_19095, partial [Myxococcota bacterium]